MSNPVLILYLEDNPLDAELVRDKLEQTSMACELRVASDRAEYEAALAQTRFDLILSDYSLPNFDGMAALALARAQQPEVPFILISGMLGEEQAVDCVLRGATDYLLKQRLERLVPAVLRALAEAEERQKRRGAEEALRHERDFVAKVIDTSPIGIVAHNHQGEITFANAEAERVLGLTRDEAGHRYDAPDWRITDYEGRPFPDEELPFRRVRATGRPVYDVRCAIENASGELVYLSINGAPALGENGEWDGMIASINDVSKLTRAEATRGLLEVELVQSRKMEAVGRLATGVAHNFNNLLTAINGYGELLLARLPPDSDLRPDLEEIERAGERAAEVARGLLRFSRRGREHSERLDLNSVITEMETLLRQVIRSNIEIVTVLADDLDRVKNNQSLIEQVIVNLVLNSSDAMPDGGKLTIETANLRLAEPRLVRNLSLPAGNFVTLAVRDSGIGMDEETQARIFEPFYTTKDPDSGTGLGLSTVCGIIEESEGAVLVESAPGQGSTFTIFLPSIPDQRLRP